MMRSIKPGRGPSAMGAVGGTVGVVFGLFWTVMAVLITRDSPFPLVGILFPLFGLVFVALGIANVIYNARNATAKNRFSEFDITSEAEEPDPLNEIYGGESVDDTAPGESVSARLSKVEELKDQGLISDAEYLEHRERILSEI